jgi:hypothetical protein
MRKMEEKRSGPAKRERTSSPKINGVKNGRNRSTVLLRPARSGQSTLSAMRNGLRSGVRTSLATRKRSGPTNGSSIGRQGSSEEKIGAINMMMICRPSITGAKNGTTKARSSREKSFIE